MTKLQELIGLVEEADKSTHWYYFVEYLTGYLSIRRYPCEGRIVKKEYKEDICLYANIQNDSEMSVLCFKMKELIKEDNEVISKDEIELLCKRAWKYGKEESFQ